MARLGLWKFDEASSGTTPTSILDSETSPKNLAITYNGAAAWTSITGYGKALSWPSANTSTYATAATSGDKFTTAFGGSATRCSLTIAGQVNSGISNCFYGAMGVGWQNTAADGVLLQCGDKTGTTAVDIGISATINGTGGDWAILVGGSTFPANGYHVFHAVIDTPNATANNRALIYVDGFVAADASSGTAGTVPQNGTLPAITDLECGGLSFDPTTYHLNGFDTALGAMYDTALSARQCLMQALRLFADNGSDADPDAAGANLCQAGTNGGTNDASTATSDHTVAPTQTVAASGNNRGLFAIVTGAGVSAGVSGTPTFNGTNGTKITSTLSGSNCVEIWWWNDAALPASAGTYSASITVDGASGTAAATLLYCEGVSQIAPTNFGSATGTGTSLTASMTSNPAAGSILLAGLLDATTTDAPTHGVNQLPCSSVNGTSTGNTHKHVSSAKYVSSAGANSMSWTGLTNTSAKIGVAIEVAVFTATAPVVLRSRARSTSPVDTIATPARRKLFFAGEQAPPGIAYIGLFDRSEPTQLDKIPPARRLPFLFVRASSSLSTGASDETDTALALALTKQLAVGLSPETDAALALAPTKQLATGLSPETDLGLSLALQKQLVTGVAIEADAALAVALNKSLATGLATEADSVQPLTLQKQQAVGVALETDAAVAASLQKVLGTGLATESDIAFSTYSSAMTPGVGDEADVAFAPSLAKQLAPGFSASTEATLAPSLAKNFATGVAVETDAALATTLAKNLSAGVAVESDAAFAPSLAKQLSPSAALETDAALARAWSKQLLTQPGLEADTAFATGLTSGFSVSASGESDSAFAPALVKQLTTGISSETDAASALPVQRSVSPGVSVEVGVALSLSLQKRLNAGAADETDAAFGLLDTTTYLNPGRCDEADAALALALSKSASVGIAAETDVALPLGLVSVGAIRPPLLPSGSVVFVPTLVAPIFPAFFDSTSTVFFPALGRDTKPAFIPSTSQVFPFVVASRGDLIAGMLPPGATSLFLRR